MREKRRQRVSSFLRSEIASIIQREIKDPRLGLVSVTKVEPTEDLKEATVHVSVLGNEAQQRTTMRGLASATRHIQTLLGARVHFRNTPQLRFVLDRSIELAMDMEELIRKAREDDEAAAEERSGRSEAPASEEE